MLNDLFEDVAFAVRSYRRTLAVVLLAVLALALGIGSTAAGYTLVDAVLLRPLPYGEPDQLVGVEPRIRDHARGASYPDWKDLTERNHTLSGIAAWLHSPTVITGSDSPANVEALAVTPNFFRVIGVQPSLGRGFGDEDGRVGSQAIVISHALWQSRYGGRGDIVGLRIEIDGKPALIVGVMPAGFRFPLDAAQPPPQLYVPFPRDPIDGQMTTQRSMRWFRLFGRLRPGVTVAAAQADFDAVASAMCADHPSDVEDANLGLRITALREAVVAPIRIPLLLLMFVVVLVLLIACANIGGLLLARAASRRREIAIRTVLGASRGRLVRQMLTESAVLALVGGALGSVLAGVALPLLRELVGSSLPHVHEPKVDARVIGFTTIVALVSSVAFGLPPALQRTRALADGLKEAARSTSSGSTRRLRNALLVGQTAVAFLLVTGAVLTLRTFLNLKHVDPGFRPQGLAIGTVVLPARYPTPADQDRYYRRLSDEVRSIPGASSAALGAPLPFSRSGMNVSVHVLGQPQNPTLPTARLWSVSPTYFSTMGIALKDGRVFTDVDDAVNAAPTVVVSADAADRLWPGESALGKRLVVGIKTADGPGDGTVAEVIGVVGATRHEALDRAELPSVYVPLGRIPVGVVGVVVRSDTPRAMVGAIRQAMLAVDHDLPPLLAATMDSLMSETIQSREMLMKLLLLFATIALVLASVGVYAIISYTVAQRTREMAIRVALGASPRRVATMVVGETLRLAACAVALGVAAALALGSLVSAVLFGVEAHDPPTLAATSAVILFICLMAAWLPARRAALADPAVAFRQE